MNEFIMLNWYHYDLNFNLINNLKTKKEASKELSIKESIKRRMFYDFSLKIKYD